MWLMFCLPSIALLGNISISRTSFWDFAAHSAPQTIVAGLIWLEQEAVPAARRRDKLARHPLACGAVADVLSALIQVIFRCRSRT